MGAAQGKGNTGNIVRAREPFASLAALARSTGISVFRQFSLCPRGFRCPSVLDSTCVANSNKPIREAGHRLACDRSKAAKIDLCSGTESLLPPQGSPSLFLLSGLVTPGPGSVF